MTVQVVKEFDMKLFKKATKEHAKCFDRIIRRLFGISRKGAFISSFISDYVWDINSAVVENPKASINRYWNGDVQLYADQLQRDVKNARNIVINAYFAYIADEDYLKKFSPNEMQFMTLEYLGETGTSEACSARSAKEFRSLTPKHFKELNHFLRKAGFEEVKEHNSNIIYLNKNRHLFENGKVNMAYVESTPVYQSTKKALKDFFYYDFSD